jgi:hypothetical protein
MSHTYGAASLPKWHCSLGGLLLRTTSAFHLHIRSEISWPPEWLSACKEGPCSVQLKRHGSVRIQPWEMQIGRKLSPILRLAHIGVIDIPHSTVRQLPSAILRSVCFTHSNRGYVIKFCELNAIRTGETGITCNATSDTASQLPRLWWRLAYRLKY